MIINGIDVRRYGATLLTAETKPPKMTANYEMMSKALLPTEYDTDIPLGSMTMTIYFRGKNRATLERTMSSFMQNFRSSCIMEEIRGFKGKYKGFLTGDDYEKTLEKEKRILTLEFDGFFFDDEAEALFDQKLEGKLYAEGSRDTPCIIEVTAKADLTNYKITLNGEPYTIESLMNGETIVINGKTGKITKREIVEDQLNKDFKRTLEAESEVAKMLTQRIINRDLQLKPIRQFQRIDGLTQKLRDICQESPEQQVFEYIGVYALKPLFRAKILPIQYGSIPNKGGVAGKRKIERLLRKKFHGKVVALKGDVTKAYPSVTVPIVMEMLRRDIGKNKVLLWFLGALMSNYPGNHLCIGGYLPAWLFNYVMSYVLRYIYEQAQIRRGKRNRLVYAIVCYADDFTIYGDVSKLKKARSGLMTSLD